MHAHTWACRSKRSTGGATSHQAKAARIGMHLRYDSADVFAWVEEQKATAA
jgi:hypothetical protein